MAVVGQGPSRELHTGRKMYSKEKWAALKPIIQRLYVDENQTFRQVASCLARNHGFSPTKKQFLRRIKEWGLEKNVKGDERRAILRKLDEEAENWELGAKKLRGRKLDRAKIERWRKREHANGACRSSSDAVQAGKKDENVEDITHHDAEMAPAQLDQSLNFNPWLSVDVIGSPRLTGLIGALTLEVCNEIQDLDLSASHFEDEEESCDLRSFGEQCRSVQHTEDQAQTPSVRLHNSVSFTIRAISTCLSKQGQPQIPSPLDGLWPLSRSVRPKKLLENPRTSHLTSENSLKMKGFECRTRLKTLRTFEPLEIVSLIEDMRSIAHRHFELGHRRMSELWWRRVVSCSLGLPGYQPLKILYACLQVINNVRLQGRIAEAQNLHRDVHQKIMNLVNPDHELSIFSKETLADMQGDFGDYDSEVAIYREILQICLLRFGVRDALTLERLLWLGWALNESGQTREAETILCLQVELYCQSPNEAERELTMLQNELRSMSMLAACLNKQQRYEESENVLDMAQGRFMNLLRLESRWCWHYYDERAEVFRAKGRLLESEEILRGILRNAPNHPDWAIMNKMQKLADFLTETGRGAEAVIWMEKIFSMGIELYGITHRCSREDCKQLGFCYAKQGRYDDAVKHFQHVIEKLALSEGGDAYSRSAYTEELRGWIVVVEEMRGEAEAEESPATFTILGEVEEDLSVRLYSTSSVPSDN